MTLRQILELMGDDWRQCVLIGCDILRSIHQGEPCTQEGCWASALEWTKHYGMPTEESVDKWLTDLGEIADKEIDPRFVQMIVDAED